MSKNTRARTDSMNVTNNPFKMVNAPSNTVYSESQANKAQGGTQCKYCCYSFHFFIGILGLSTVGFGIAGKYSTSFSMPEKWSGALIAFGTLICIVDLFQLRSVHAYFSSRNDNDSISPTI